MGCQAIADCTAAYFGRHPEILRRFSQQSGLHILTNTGYYAAASDQYVPAHAYNESADQIAGRWTCEWIYSIDGTGVLPGFIKTAVDEGPLSEIDHKLIVAAARTHLQTGLTIQTHTGDNWAAVQEMLTIFEQEEVHPSAWIWTHAHHVQDFERLVSAAQAGAWISLDAINEGRAPHILEQIKALRQRGYLSQVLLSHDGDSYFGDGESRPYHYLFTDLLPMLKRDGFTDPEIEQLTIRNPSQAFTVQVRRKG
jgi:phosphotriesterase-related protein